MSDEAVARIGWGYPMKDLPRLQRRLSRDLKFYGGRGTGNCARLDERHPLIVPRQRKNGLWYQIEVDDVTLPLVLTTGRCLR